MIEINMHIKFNCYFYMLLIIICNIATEAKKYSEKEKPAWTKKDIRDYNEADLERLLDQWEEDEEPLPNDEQPPHLQTPPPIQFDPNNVEDPEKLLQMSKKGRTLMMFVRVQDRFSKEEAESLTQRWQGALWNNHIQAERYMVDDKRAIFMFKDGSQAWEAKNYLIEQEELHDCTIENRPYYGKNTKEWKKEASEKSGNDKQEL